MLQNGTIGIISAIVGAMTQLFFSTYFQDFQERLKLRKSGYSNLRGKWSCAWFTEHGANEKLYSEDTVNITKIRGFEIEGNGEDSKDSYYFTGKISLHGVITINYFYKNSTLSGVATLKLDPMGKSCSGVWCGYLKEQVIDGGKVIWKKN